MTDASSSERMSRNGGAETSLTPVVFSTDRIEPRHHLDYWIGKYESFNRLDLSAEVGPGGFGARNEVWLLGDLAVLTTFGPAVAFERTQRHIRRDSIDHRVIRFTRSGQARHRVGDCCAVTAPHVPLVFSLGEPYSGDRSEAEWVSLYLPRDRFPELSAGLGRLPSPVIDTPGAGLLADYVLCLLRRLPGMTAAQIPMVINATRSMIAACLLTDLDPTNDPPPIPQVAQLELVRRIVRQNIASATLGPDKICQLAGMSRSQLYRLLERHGGVAHYVQQMRLQLVHAALSDMGTAHLRIAVVAERAGFFDASAFSRAFRRQFGYAPRDARAMASGALLTCTRGVPPHGSRPTQDFGTVVRHIGASAAARARAA